MKDDDPESFLRNYKRTCISTGSRNIENWVTYLSEFSEESVCHLYERQPKALQAQRHSVKNLIFERIKLLVLKYFMIKLLLKLLQQVKYEGVDTLEDVICIVEKKEGSFELTPIIPPKDTADIHHTSLRASSSTNTLHSSNTSSQMEAAMEQPMSQITQLTFIFFNHKLFAKRNEIRTRYNITLAKKWVIYREIVRIMMQ